MVIEVQHFEKVSKKIESDPNTITAFLAGAISHSIINWQSLVLTELEAMDESKGSNIEPENQKTLLVYNPRELHIYRSQSYINPTPKQLIDWDMDKMSNSNILAFYFGDESGQHSTLFELGYYLSNTSKKQIIVVIDKNYPKRNKLIAYLRNILGSKYTSIVNDSGDLKTLAVLIYAKYLHIAYPEPIIDEYEE